MYKKKYLPFDAIHFSFKMLCEQFYFFLKFFSVATLLFCGIPLLVLYVKCGCITQNDFRTISTALNYFIIERVLGITEQLKEIEPTSFTVLPLFVSIYLLICDMISSVLSITLYDDKYISFKETVSHLRRIPSYLGVAAIYSLATRLGYDLFIIPGLLMEVRLRLSKYFIIDKNVGVIQALKGSWHISKGHMFDLFMLFIIGRSIVVIGSMMSNGLRELIANDIISVVIICYITSICLFINVCAHVFLYRKLLEEKQKQLKSVNIIDENDNQISTPIQANI